MSLPGKKDQMGLFIRTTGIRRAEARITPANPACTMHRLIFHEQPAAIGQLRPNAGKSQGKRPQQTPKSLQSNHIQRRTAKSAQTTG